MSRRVQALEVQLGTRLLQGSTRKLTLTGAGEAFQERCANSVDGLIDAGQKLTTGHDGPRRATTGHDGPSGLVRVAAPADFFDFIPMEWVSGFVTAHPRVRLNFMLSDAKADLIAERIDVAFRGGMLRDSGCVGRQVLRDGNDMLVASPVYIAARASPGTLQELVGHDCVSSAHPSGQATWRLTGPDGIEEEVQMAPRFSGNTAQVLRKATMAGLGSHYCLTRSRPSTFRRARSCRCCRTISAWGTA